MNTHSKHEISQHGEAFPGSSAGPSPPSWGYRSSFSATLWDPASPVVFRVIWATIISFLVLPSIFLVSPWSEWLFIPPYACEETLLATPVSSRSYSQYCWCQPLTYQDLSNQTHADFITFLLFAFFETSGVRFSGLFLQVWKQTIHFLLLMKTLIFTQSCHHWERPQQTLGWGSQ